VGAGVAVMVVVEIVKEGNDAIKSSVADILVSVGAEDPRVANKNGSLGLEVKDLLCPSGDLCSGEEI
jgi:hypothetical protein